MLRTINISPINTIILGVFASVVFLSCHARADDIQMLPPLGCPTIGAAGILSWVNDGRSTLNCSPGLTVSPGGVVTGASFSSPTFSGGTFSGTTITASTSVIAPTAVINGSIATNATIDTANSLTSLWRACGEAGGGTLTVDSLGRLKCGSVATVAIAPPEPVTSPPIVTPPPMSSASCVDSVCSGQNSIVFPVKVTGVFNNPMPAICEGHYTIWATSTRWNSTCDTGWKWSANCNLPNSTSAFANCPAAQLPGPMPPS